MSTNEFMTPEIGKVIPMLTQTCDDLTRQALIKGLTQKTQEWVTGDPELADILLEGKKTLEECVRYVTEKAACVVATNINSMLNAELEQLPKEKIQGRDATMAGGAIDADQVFAWAQEYYYTPDAKPTDFKAEAKRKSDAAKAKQEADKKKAGAKKSAGKKGAAKATDKKTEVKAAGQPDSSEEAAEDTGTPDEVEQTSLFGPSAAA